MTIQVIGQSFDVGEALTGHVKDCLMQKIEKHNQELLSAKVVFTDAPHKKVLASIQAHIKIKELSAKAEGDDAYQAFNHAMNEITTQMIKAVEKISDHNHK